MSDRVDTTELRRLLAESFDGQFVYPHSALRFFARVPALLDALEEANTWANGPDDRDQAALTDWQRGYKQAQNDIGKLLALNSAPSPRGGGW